MDLFNFVGWFHFSYSNGLTTDVYIRSLFKWDWNSEHVAVWYGTRREAEWPGPAEYWQYQGILGKHLYL